jgi:hypothetical protein
MADSKAEQAKVKGPRHRSPAYLFISLRKALEKAKTFYRSQTRHPAPLPAALALWGFAEKSSGGLQTVSALKQFGLLDENEVNGTRQVKLTEAALRIIQDEREDSTERLREINRLAMLPKIYLEMWNKWSDQLPADATVKFFLVNEKKYNEAAFSDLFSAYKDTIDFAKFGKSDTDGSKDGAQGAINIPPLVPPPKGAKLMEGERIVFTHEVEPEHGVRIVASGAVDEELIDAVEMFLDLQKRRLGLTTKKPKA